jgi:molybdate transport system substrate-binding protein
VKKILSVLGALLILTVPAFSKELWVFCAMGIRDLATATAEDFKEKVVFNFSSSGRLAKQIEMGAPADLYLSANKFWVDYLKEKGFLQKGTITPIAKTELVVIVPKNSKIKRLSQAEKIAVGDRSAPVGRYALESLKRLELYDKLKKKLVFAPNLRQVAVWVATGNADAGIVYLSDYLRFKNEVNLLEVLPENIHEPIVFYGAVVKGAKDEVTAEKFLKKLKDEPEKTFEKFGFKRP